MQTQNYNKILITIIIFLVISNLFFVFRFIQDRKAVNQTAEKQRINTEILSFTKLFMEKVLRSSSTVSFDDRLLLENSVRGLKDEEIFSSWLKFTNAKSQTEVQQDFYDLFELLLKKIEE